MEQVIPDFMQKYFDGSDEEGQEHIKIIAGRYQHQKHLFYQTTFNQKEDYLRSWNRLTGQRTQLTQEEAIQPLNDKYEEQVKGIAVQYGYVDPDKSHEKLDELSQHEVDQVQQQEEVLQHKEPDELPKREMSTEERRQSAKEEFLNNLKSMRERTETHTHRPRQ